MLRKVLGKTLGKYNPFEKIRQLQQELELARAGAQRDAQMLKGARETLEDLEQRLAKSERIKAEYWDVITSIEQQRDEWNEMFKIQSAEHLEAQVWLTRELERMMAIAGKLQLALNAMIKRYQPDSAEAELFDPKKKMPALSQARRYEMTMQALEKLASEPIDGASARAEIAARDHREIIDEA